MIILGIDPGLRTSGYVLLGTEGDNLTVGPAMSEADHELVVGVIRSRGADAIAIEELAGQGRFVGLDEFRTARYSGWYERAWLDLGLRLGMVATPEFVLRLDVKKHLLGRANGKDAEVRGALMDRWGGQEAAIGNKRAPGPLYTVKGHAWQALAVAITAWETRWKRRELGGALASHDRAFARGIGGTR